ncbi:MAG: hypothetical protein KKA73_18340 [Chloroflexi bacterium]|nr:hypothetical protein [Chloroflexota bacterium]MBU1749647.1 hypothetical protein [Chloroflexota bacterium]
MVPKHIVVIETAGRSIDDIVGDMLHVPMEKSILLDFWVGHPPRSPAPDLTDDQVDLLRLQYMLNFRHHGRRFDWLGDGLIARLARESLRTGSWNPFRETEAED